MNLSRKNHLVLNQSLRETAAALSHSSKIAKREADKEELSLAQRDPRAIQDRTRGEITALGLTVSLNQACHAPLSHQMALKNHAPQLKSNLKSHATVESQPLAKLNQ